MAQMGMLLDNGMDLVVGAHQSAPQPIRVRQASSDRYNIGFFGLGQFYANPGTGPSLSLVSEVHVDTTGRTLRYEVKPLIRMRYYPGKYAASTKPPPAGLYPPVDTMAAGYTSEPLSITMATGGLDKAGPFKNVLMTLSESERFRTMSAESYDVLRKVNGSLPLLSDDTAWANEKVAFIAATDSKVKYAKFHYDFVKMHDRIKLVLSKVFQQQ
jgi:hypothetical protein